MKKISKKRSKEINEYTKLRRKFFLNEENKFCKVRVNGCLTYATDIHHMAGKENHLLLEKKYFLAVCRNCHNYITEHSREAIEKGWSLSRFLN